MPLSQRKTWSQQTLAVRLQASGPRAPAFFSVEKRAFLLLALKTAAAAGICYWLATLAGFQDGYWGSISAIIVLQSNVGSTVAASRDRLIGTLIGAAYGGAFSFLGHGMWIYLVAVTLAMVTCSLFGLKNSSRLAGVTVSIVMLVHKTQSDWKLPLHRVGEVVLGIAVALAISALVLPSQARLRLRDGLAHEFLMLGALFGGVLEGFRGKQSANLPQLWKDAEGALVANAQLLDAARHEPSGNTSAEALAMLHQFAAELLDLLKALELAVKGSGDDGYAAQLEPELGKLGSDIQKGFEYVGGCIHRWQFDQAPVGLNLEDDIAALEARMAAIRPIGLEFPQAEILRAYALQLHLKQLARRLRSARLEVDKCLSS